MALDKKWIKAALRDYFEAGAKWEEIKALVEGESQGDRWEYREQWSAWERRFNS